MITFKQFHDNVKELAPHDALTVVQLDGDWDGVITFRAYVSSTQKWYSAHSPEGIYSQIVGTPFIGDVEIGDYLAEDTQLSGVKHQGFPEDLPF